MGVGLSEMKSLDYGKGARLQIGKAHDARRVHEFSGFSRQPARSARRIAARAAAPSAFLEQAFEPRYSLAQFANCFLGRLLPAPLLNGQPYRRNNDRDGARRHVVPLFTPACRQPTFFSISQRRSSGGAPQAAQAVPGC